MKRICFVTGTRAEYGLLSRLMRQVQEDVSLQLQLIATNMHLMPEYGETYREIENDGFRIDRKVYMGKPSDDAKGVVASMTEEMKGMNEALAELKPDILVLLGDRYEVLVAAQVALIHRIPMAHIHGGEVTEGAFDDAIRHAVTKMASLHFTSCEAYRKRVVQLGEAPDRVFNVGSLGVENIQTVPLMSQAELEESLDFRFGERTLLATYHPATLGGEAAKDAKDFLSALDEIPGLRVLFTMPNSDTGRDAIAQAIKRYVALHPESKAFDSLGLRRYLSALQFVKGVVGNSSSGIIEVPSFGIPTLNIGERQKGRLAAPSVIHCGTSKTEVRLGLERCLSREMQALAKTCTNPYAKPHTARRILQVLKEVDFERLRHKSFHDIEQR